MTDAKIEPIIEYHDDGKVEYAYTVDEKGQKQGPYEEYWDNGRLREKCTYKDGKKDGPYERYYDNGRLEIKCTYKDGEYNGQYEEYWHNGQLTKKCTYKDGYEDGSCEKYQPNGRLWGKCTYKDGKEDGPYEAYHDNGQLREKGVYKMGVELKGKEAEEYLKEWEEKRIMAQKTCKGLNVRLVQINKQMAPTQLRQAVKRAEVAKFRKIHSDKKEWKKKRIMAQKTRKRLNARLVQINEQMAPTQLRQAVKRAEVAKFRKIHSYKHAGRIIEKKNWFQKLFRLGR